MATTKEILEFDMLEAHNRRLAIECAEAVKTLQIRKDFTWGEIVKLHQISDFTIVEYLEGTYFDADRNRIIPCGKTRFHIYIDGEDTWQSADTLDSALIQAITKKHKIDFMQYILAAVK